MSNSPVARGAALTTDANRWVRHQYDRGTGAFRLSPHSSPSLIGSSCAALACETLGTLSEWSTSERERCGEFIRKHQEPDGWFKDPLLEAPPGSNLDADYLIGHATFLGTMALDALGQRTRVPFGFLEGWKDDNRVYCWMDQLDWTNPWRESNWVEWIGYWLLADAGFTTDDVPFQRQHWPPGFGGLMAWLEKHQDPKTGMWGDPPFAGTAHTLHLVAAAYHLLVFYFATGITLAHCDRIVDLTLALQQPDGLFAPGRPGGGPCEDLDAIDVLANSHRFSDYRRPEIETALSRSISALVANQRASGAFVYTNGNERQPRHLESLKTAIRPSYPPGIRTRLRSLRDYINPAWNRRYQKYAGSPHLTFEVDGGDMFSQWFRPLAIAIAAKALGLDRSPVWWPFGFRRQVTQGWWPGESKESTSTKYAAGGDG